MAPGNFEKKDYTEVKTEGSKKISKEKPKAVKILGDIKKSPLLKNKQEPFEKRIQETENKYKIKNDKLKKDVQKYVKSTQPKQSNGRQEKYGGSSLNNIKFAVKDITELLAKPGIDLEGKNITNYVATAMKEYTRLTPIEKTQVRENIIKVVTAYIEARKNSPSQSDSDYQRVTGFYETKLQEISQDNTPKYQNKNNLGKGKIIPVNTSQPKQSIKYDSNGQPMKKNAEGGWGTDVSSEGKTPDPDFDPTIVEIEKQVQAGKNPLHKPAQTVEEDTKTILNREVLPNATPTITNDVDALGGKGLENYPPYVMNIFLNSLTRLGMKAPLSVSKYIMRENILHDPTSGSIDPITHTFSKQEAYSSTEANKHKQWIDEHKKETQGLSPFDYIKKIGLANKMTLQSTFTTSQITQLSALIDSYTSFVSPHRLFSDPARTFSIQDSMHEKITTSALEELKAKSTINFAGGEKLDFAIDGNACSFDGKIFTYGDKQTEITMSLGSSQLPLSRLDFNKTTGEINVVVDFFGERSAPFSQKKFQNFLASAVGVALDDPKVENVRTDTISGQTVTTTFSKVL